MLTPFGRFMKRILEIHGSTDGEVTCPKCGDTIPCDTIRAVWIYDLETGHEVSA